MVGIGCYDEATNLYNQYKRLQRLCDPSSDSIAGDWKALSAAQEELRKFLRSL